MVQVFRLENYMATYGDGESIQSDKAYMFLGMVKYDDMPESILSAITAAYYPSTTLKESEYVDKHPELELSDVSVHLCDATSTVFKITDDKVEFEFDTYQDENKGVSCHITADKIGPGKLWMIYPGNNALRVKFDDVFDSLKDMMEFKKFLHTGKIFNMKFVQMTGDKV